MANLLVDPYLVALPQTITASELAEFVEGILAWGEALSGGVEVCLPTKCLETLMQEGLYPAFPRLESLFKQYGVDYADLETVQRSVAPVFEQPCLEERIDCPEVLFDEREASVDHAVIISRLPPAVGQSLLSSLVQLSYWQRIAQPDEPPFTFAAAPDPSLIGENTLTVSATIEEAQPQPPPGLLPFDLAETIPLYVGYADFTAVDSLTELWGTADSFDDAKRAIDLRIDELVRSGFATQTAVKQFILGNEILRECRECGFTRKRSGWVSRLLNTCARIALDKPLEKVRPLRKSKTSTKQVKRKDGALAYRTHVTKEREGFRLMYWVCPDQTIEFASIAVKLDVDID